MEATQQTNVQSIDERLWNDVRQALSSIAAHAEDILAQWVVVGQRLAELRRRNPGYRNSGFAAACRMHGIALKANERSAAQWWGRLDNRQRDVLSEKNPAALHPKTLQDRCRETHPEWLGVAKSHTSPSRGSIKKQQKTTSALLLPATTRKQIEAEVFREEVKAKRERLAAAAAEAAVNDRRPKFTETPYPVVMYGRQLWPVTDAEKVHLGQYDYDQLVTATYFFIALRDLAPAQMTIADLAKNLRLRTRALHKFIERRLTSPTDQEMRRFLGVFHLLCGLLESNPTGECRPPSDRALLDA